MESDGSENQGLPGTVDPEVRGRTFALAGCALLALAFVALAAFSFINALSHFGDCFAETVKAGLNGTDEGPVFARHVVFHTTDELGARAPVWPPSASATMTFTLPGADETTVYTRVFADGRATPLVDTGLGVDRDGQRQLYFPILQDCGKNACAAGFTIVAQTATRTAISWTLDAETLFGCGAEQPPANLLTVSTDGSRTVDTVTRTLALPRDRIDLTADHASDQAEFHLTLSPPDASWDARTGPVVEVLATPIEVAGHPWLSTAIGFSVNGQEGLQTFVESTFDRARFSTHPFDHCSGSTPCSADVAVTFSRNTVPVEHYPPTPTPIPTDVSAATSVILTATVLELPVGASVTASRPDGGSIAPFIVAVFLAAALAGLVIGVMVTRAWRRRSAS
jgi:hypothetical protein